MKLLCFGDLHLGQGSHIPGRLDDQQAVLGRIAGIAVERGVDGILFAGDAFEGPTVPPEQLQVFARFVEACRLADVPILAITGNGKHDAAVRDTNGLAIFDHIDGIEVHSQPTWVEFAGCAVATLPWVHPGRLIARAGRDIERDEVNRIAAELLVDVARELANEMPADKPKITLGHWSVSGTALPAGLPVDDLREPVLSAAALDDLGFDHIVMGHIHRPQTICSNGFYTGSPMPLNHGEAHVGHGVAILHVGERQEIDFPGAEYVEIDSPRFITVEAELVDRDVDDPHAALTEVLDAEEIARGNLALYDDAIVRFRFNATREQLRRVDVSALRHWLTAAGARSVKIEPTIVREQRARVEGVDEQLDELAALDLYIAANDLDEQLAASMRHRTRDYLEAVA